MSKPDWSKAPKGFPLWIESTAVRFTPGWYRDDGGRFISPVGGWLPYAAETAGRAVVHRKPRWRYHWGGPCPVRVSQVDVMSRNGEVVPCVYARSVSWSNPWQEGEDPGEDIVAFRLPD